jgi:dGTPase
LIVWLGRAWFYIINRPSLATVQYGQERVITELHNIYLEAAKDQRLHKLFPSAQQDALREASHDMRCVTDLVSSLTEDMAFELHARLTGAKKGSILDAPAVYSK